MAVRSLCRRFVCFSLSLSLWLGLCLPVCAKESSGPLSLSPITLEGYPLYEQEERSARAYIVMEASTGRILMGKNIHQRLPQASTTKIMGAMMVLEQPNLDEYFEVDAQAIQVEGSSMGLAEGDLVSLYALACGMMLPSGNDAANAAGVRLYGSVPGFVDAMNRRAQELHLENTHYVTACGLDAPDHYSSAFDLAKLCRIALQNPLFSEICCQTQVKVRFGSVPYDRWLKNYNRLLQLYPDCIGVKTGFTDDAGRCLVSAAQRDEMTLICVTLNAQNDWNLHASLYEQCFQAYRLEPLPSCPARIPLAGGSLSESGTEAELPLIPAWSAKLPLKSGEADRLKSCVLAQPFCYFPPEPNRVYAQALYLLDGQPLCTVPLVAALP